MPKQKDIHILVKKKNGKNRYYPYIVAPAHGVLWVTKEKTLSPVEEHRAYVSSWDRVSEIMKLIESGEIR